MQNSSSQGMPVEFMFVSEMPLRFAAEGEDTMYKAIWKRQGGQDKIVR